jgi:hypothetical protein
MLWKLLDIYQAQNLSCLLREVANPSRSHSQEGNEKRTIISLKIMDCNDEPYSRLLSNV